jgi:hypothetical protein
MTWFAFPQGTDTLQVFNLNGAAEKAMTVTAAHGYATMAEAVAKPNATPDSAQDIQIGLDDQTSGATVGGGITGVLESGTYNTKTKKFTKGGTNAQAAAGAAKDVAGAAAGALSDTIGITGINTKYLVARIAKIAIGGILVIVGVAHMTGFSKGIVGTAVKAAPFLL